MSQFEALNLYPYIYCTCFVDDKTGVVVTDPECPIHIELDDLLRRLNGGDD